MASKVFLDANIILDYTLNRQHHVSAEKVITWGINGQIQLFITPSIIHILSYWLKRAYGIKKTKEIILTLLADIQVIDIDHEITVNAIHSQMSDIEDALQYYSALHHKMDYFISRDKGFARTALPVLPIYTPEEFIKEFS